MSQNAFLDELFVIRGIPSTGFNPINFVELYGGEIIEPTAFEPDPTTHRSDFYYNADVNTLYKKVITRKENGITTAHWQKASE